MNLILYLRDSSAPTWQRQGETTLAQFVDDNEMDAEDAAAVVLALDATGEFIWGGGAAVEFKLERAA